MILLLGMYKFLWILLIQCLEIDAANWAQASGFFEQNVVIPKIPAADTPNLHWQARFGMVIVHSTDPLGGIGKVYLMGGDTYDGSEGRENFGAGLLDQRWSNGYKNDVWSMTTAEWKMKGNVRLRTEYKQKIPDITSELTWNLINRGESPPPGMTYNNFTICEKYFLQQSRYAAIQRELCTNPRATQWSPRRHHAGVFFKGYLYVMGGRAREFVGLPEIRSVGGILGPRVMDVKAEGVNWKQLQTTQREASVNKNDVWRSSNGVKWELVTPGCSAPQRSLIAKGNPVDGKAGISEKQCKTDSDCFGAETCDVDQIKGTTFQKGLYTCVCPMWTPREQFALAQVENKLMFVSGGYASVLLDERTTCGPYACGDTDSSAYRYYLSDIWYSADGEIWHLLTERAFDGLGRGGHAMLVIPTLPNWEAVMKGQAQPAKGNPYIWIFGGRGGDTQAAGEIYYYNDIWVLPIPLADILVGLNDPSKQFQFNPNTMININNGSVPGFPWSAPNISWSPRAGHTVTLAEIGSQNKIRTLYLIGGTDGSGGDGRGNKEGTFLDDTWSWRLDIPNEFWRKDYTKDEIYGIFTQSNIPTYYNNSPAAYYISPTSDISYLRRWWTPTRFRNAPGHALSLELREYLTAEEIDMLRRVGINTVTELAEADKYTVLKLRGFDVPDVPMDQRMNFDSICDKKALAQAIVQKCTVDPDRFIYDNANRMPWNVIPEFGGKPPAANKITWHNRKNYNFLDDAIDDVVTLVASWDGCQYINVSKDPAQRIHGPNVVGIGYVSVPLAIRDPEPENLNLFCKWYPGGRAYHGAVSYDDRLYLFGGKQTETKFFADTWYRNPIFPYSNFKSKPASNTPNPIFEFDSNTGGRYFEYQVWDPINFKVLRPWTPVLRKTDVGWLDWREGGPGNGYYTMYFRAVDPAGNRDVFYRVGGNVYRWYYVSPTPWDIILAVIGSVLGLAIFSYMEYRRRVKKAAMERYAMKRMRRKFKAMQRDIDGRAVDWRTLYMESKEAEAAGGKKRRQKAKGKERDRKAEKRDKEKKKREKEKEQIKKKLKATREGAGGVSTKSTKEPKAEEVVDLSRKAAQKKGKKKKGEPDDEEGITLAELEAGASKKSKKMKDYEVAAGAGVDEKKKKAKFKEYEGKEAMAAVEAVPAESGKAGASSSALEEGTKQRRPNKRYKDYEVEDGAGNDDEQKKNV